MNEDTRDLLREASKMLSKLYVHNDLAVDVDAVILLIHRLDEAAGVAE